MPTQFDYTRHIPRADWFTTIIKCVKSPLGFFVLLVLVLFVVLVPATVMGQLTAIHWIFSLMTFIVAAFVVLLTRYREVFNEEPDSTHTPNGVGEESFVETNPDQVPKEWQNIYGADRPAPPINTWDRQLRPSLYQASYYSIPTYYLDPDLYVIDFNAAFEVVFRRISGTLRGRHVNWFIRELHNRDDVFRAGQKFTDEVAQKHAFPFVHTEPIVYQSDDFGQVKFTKLASQLHDADGKLCGWAVALMPRTIDWGEFERVLGTKLYQDKLWSVYSGPYDRILREFAPYNQLIDEVISVVPDGQHIVGDLGAGTGNVSEKLAARGHRVVAIENSLGMLDRLTQKTQGNPNVNVVKASIENLGFLKDSCLDAVVMVNVLYAVDDPIGCLREVNRLLRPGGLIGMSTTHRETRLDELLEAIKRDVRGRVAQYQKLAGDYALLERLNRSIETSIARRHTRQDYRRFLESAGFDVTRVVDSTYHNAVMVLHARKRG